MINREDMLELTRRMTPSRNCFDRLAGVYMDEDGYDTGSFNINFLKLDAKDRDRCLAIAKSIPFSDTNEQLKMYKFPGDKPDIYKLLYSLNICELKNDAALYTLYEIIGETYDARGKEYCVYVYHGAYDVPRKAADKEWLQGSEEVYRFLIVAICSCENNIPSEVQTGFMYPAFSDRSEDRDHILIYENDKNMVHKEIYNILGISK